MKPALQHKLSPQLTMTPQLQQAIRLLQLSTIELQQTVQETLIANPMLENLDEIEPREESDHYEPSYSPVTSYESHNTSSQGSYDLINQLPTATTLKDHLLWQLQLGQTTATEYVIGTTLIDAIDESGYMRSSLSDIQDSLNSEWAVNDKDVVSMLHRIQCFDPAGVGATDLRQCLLLQLARLPDTTQALKASNAIVHHCLDALAKQDYKSIMRKLHLTQTALNDAIALIHTLHPKPGALIATSRTEYIIPDILVKKCGECFKVELNPATVPRLQINLLYAQWVKRGHNTPDNLFLKHHLQEAKWFIKTLHNRHHTLLQVARWIVEYQQPFFQLGALAMRPLSLKDIADNLDLHESTISRVTTHKYLHTPRGMFEMKYFFSNAMNTSMGNTCSSTAIRATLKEIIAEENPKKPLADSKIATLLTQQGLPIARRTVAKYRDIMNIPSTRERKRRSTYKL